MEQQTKLPPGQINIMLNAQIKDMANMVDGRLQVFS